MADYSDLMGWHDDQSKVEQILSTLPYPYMGVVGQSIAGTGAKKIQLLYKFVEVVTGKYPTLFQKIGDCVSMGTSGAVTNLTATQIVLLGLYEQWGGICSTEDIYWGSRVIIGQGRLGYQDGSIGAWAAQYCQKYGTLVRKKYDSIDLSVYDGNKAREWGKPGTKAPNILLPYANEHKVGTITLVSTYEQVRDAIVSGYPVTICSNQGFSTTRDREGFCRPQGTWPHCMLINAVDDEYKRPGVLIQNSWGPDWVNGPTRHEQPAGSFWCDADVLERYILRGNDSWAFSNFQGFPKQDIDWNIAEKAKQKLKDFDGIEK